MAFSAVEFALDTGTDTAVSVALTSAPSSGDLVVAFGNYNANTASETITPGQTWDASGSVTPGSETTQHWWGYKVAGGSEPSTYTWTLSGGTNHQFHVAVFSASAGTPTLASGGNTFQKITVTPNDDIESTLPSSFGSHATGALSILSAGVDNRNGTGFDYDGADDGFTAGIGTDYGTSGTQAMGFAYQIWPSGGSVTGSTFITNAGGGAPDADVFSRYLVFQEGAAGGGFKGLTLLGVG